MTETESPQQPSDEDVRLLRRTLALLTDEVRLQGELMKAQNAQIETYRRQLERQTAELRQTRQELALHRLLQRGVIARLATLLARVCGWLRMLVVRARAR